MEGSLRVRRACCEKPELREGPRPGDRSKEEPGWAFRRGVIASPVTSTSLSRSGKCISVPWYTNITRISLSFVNACSGRLFARGYAGRHETIDLRACAFGRRAQNPCGRSTFSSDAFVLRRCRILLPSSRGERASRISRNLGCDSQAVRSTPSTGSTDRAPRSSANRPACGPGSCRTGEPLLEAHRRAS